MKRLLILAVLLALLAGCVRAPVKAPENLASGTIERAGVIDANGDGIQSWNGGTIGVYSDSGETLTWSVSGSTGDLTAGDTIVFEGATADGYETTFAITDPTSSDKTITFPNSSGTVALNPYGASIEFEGATADDYETTLAVVDPAGIDKTITLPNVTGTVHIDEATQPLIAAAATIGGDVTLTADSTGGNAGAKTEYIGLPRIKLIGGGQGTNPAGQTIALVDDTPDGEYAAVDASVVLTANTATYKYGAKSLKAAWGVGAAATDGFLDANLGAGAAWDDMESVGLLVYATTTWAAGDLTLVLTDNGGARTYNIPALTAANVWTWLEVDISAGDLSAVSDVAILMSAAGETALGAFDMYLDIAYVWDSVDEEALGVAIQSDGVLGVIDTESGASLVEGTDYLVHYESGVDFIVYISDQSGADIAVLAAY